MPFFVAILLFCIIFKGGDAMDDILTELPVREKYVCLSEDVPFYSVSSSYAKTTSVLPHYHEAFEVVYFPQGRGEALINGKHYSEIKDRVFMIAPEFVHAFRIMPFSNAKIIQFSIKYTKPYIDIEGILKTEGVLFENIEPCHKNYNEIKDYIKNLTEEKAAVASVLRFFSSILSNIVESANKTTNTNNSPERLKRVLNWTLKNLNKPIGTKEASEVVGLSKYYFCRYFKEQTGRVYTEYLSLLRIEQAKKLLRGGMSVGICAYECGFESVSYFVKIFKRYVGITPKKFCRV